MRRRFKKFDVSDYGKGQCAHFVTNKEGRGFLVALSNQNMDCDVEQKCRLRNKHNVDYIVTPSDSIRLY